MLLYVQLAQVLLYIATYANVGEGAVMPANEGSDNARSKAGSQTSGCETHTIVKCQLFCLWQPRVLLPLPTDAISIKI